MISIATTSLHVSGNITLHLIDHHHAASLFNLVEKNRSYLQEWLPWVDKMQHADDIKAYISMCMQEHEAGISKGYVIEVNGTMAGRIGLHHIDANNKSAAIGYWLDEAHTGSGIITRCCKTLLQQAFQEMQLNRIEIKCATGNYKSIAIPERLGFINEGILHQAAWVNKRFVDYIFYSLLQKEWAATN